MATKKSTRANENKKAAAAAASTSTKQPKRMAEVLPQVVEEIHKTRTEKQEAARQRRAELRTLSNQLKEAVATGMMQPSEDNTINGLLRMFYAAAGHTELKTFDEWKKAGFIVRKGQKALLLWGRPRKQDKQSEATEEDTTAQEFFPTCYVFSRTQVHAMQTTQA